jgi:glycosyltransferase involved in cell wall biosynthesis
LTIGTPVGRRLLHPSHVIAVSRSVQRALQPVFGMGVRVVPNFIPDTVTTTPARAEGLPEGRFVLFAGDPSRHKGIDVLLESWRRADRPDAELVLAVTRSLERELPAHVSVVRLSHAQMSDAWTRATVAVVPSIWADPFPTVAL